MKYKHDGGEIIRGVLSADKCELLTDYFTEKRRITLFLQNEYQMQDNCYGHMRDPQVMDTYSIYGDPMTDMLMTKLKPAIEGVTGVNLIPTYTYTRIYKTGDTLEKHTDRESCRISTSMNLGGDTWPIFLEGKEIVLNPGDLLVYDGCDREHWRESFNGEYCTQTFFHYNDSEDSQSEANRFDGRPILGIPLNWLPQKT